MKIPKCIACRYKDFSLPWYRQQEDALKIRDIYKGHSAAQVDFVNRKFWEWCAIAQSLEDREMLQEGKRGLGFAVGTEPLAAYFANKGCKILATDLAPEVSEKSWIDRNEHAASLNAVYYPELISRLDFDKNVSFQPADMRTLSDLTGKYDFLWSSCALEHLGTLQAGIEYIMKSAQLLDVGGVAVHTTEFNVNSDDATVVEGPNVLYRKRDLEELSSMLRKDGFTLLGLDFDIGSHQYDIEYDTEPYMESGKPHIKLDISGYVSTSFLLVIERA